MPVVIQTDDGQVLVVTEDTRAVIGREKNLDITVNHPRVSRQHLDIRFDNGAWLARDLNSSNGSWVEGQPVSEVAITATLSVNLGSADGPHISLSLVESLAHQGQETPAGHIPPAPKALAQRLHLTLPPLLRIGSHPSNEICIDGDDVDQFQATISRNSRGSHEIVDPHGSGKTLVNGRVVSKRQRLAPGDIITVGWWTRRYTGNAVEHVDASGGYSFVADDITVTAGEKTLLDHISFQLRPRTLTAVIGPSGAGKSTLLGALTGRRPATSGSVYVGGLDLYEQYKALKNRIGLVPQSDLLHTTLSTRKALEYAAALRFPRGVTKAEQLERVVEVIDLLGLTERQHLPISALSGGQRKRASVALELLTEPELLFLDEPTSGLDPGLDRQVMNQLRDLANGGRTVLVVTHSVANLDVCDEVILLAPGGKLAYHGPAHNVLPHFGAKDWSEVFDILSDPALAPKALDSSDKPPVAVGKDTTEIPLLPQQLWPKQLLHLVIRYLHVIGSDKYFLVLLGALPFVLAMVGFAVGTDSGFGPGPEDEFGLNPQARPLLLVLILGASFMGLAASVQELVKERTIYERERSVGLSASAYLASKVLVLGVLVTAQTTIFVLISLADRDMPDSGVVLANPLLEVLIVTVALALSSMLLGLLISALVNSSEVTMPALVLATMGQVILSGAVPIRQSGLLDIIGLPNPGYWAMTALATTSDLNVISALPEDDQGAFWEATSDNWWLAMSILIALSLTMLAGTRLMLKLRER